MSSFQKRTKDFVQARAQAAQWMQEKNVADGHYWRWPVLTAAGNPQDPTNPHLPPETAGLIFADFVAKGLLVPVLVDGHEAYLMNPGKGREWREIAHPPNPVIAFFIAHILTFVGYVVSALVGWAVGKFLG